MTAPLALLLLGPTASGKSALSLALARRHPVEIISIDSALVYRGMDIGSAKPTPEERSVCPHHLIDVREIDEPYSAADFLTDTAKLVPEIRAGGRVPLIVGGTMLYAKALREGLNDLPTTTPEVRSEVLEEGERLGWPAMWEKLREIDPETAARLQPADRQRIGRAIEVWRMTGKTLSSFHAKAAEPLFPMLSVGLLPPDRKLLHRRIEERFDAMLDAGFLAEVRDLMILAVPALADICDDLTFEDQEIPYDGLESCWAEPAEVVPEIKAIASAPAMAALAPASDVMMVAPPSAVAMICMPVESTQASEPAEVLEEAQEGGPWAEVSIPEMEVPASADPVEMTVISPETDDSPEVEIDEPATITEDSPTVMFSFGSQETGRGGWRVCFSF